jgi:hypothetical protein
MDPSKIGCEDYVGFTWLRIDPMMGFNEHGNIFSDSTKV